MLKIGDLAKICNVSTQTLRYYDSEGILKADITDPWSGYRFYSVDAVEKYKKILFYKNLGFSLEEIKEIQSATDDKLKSILQNKKEILFDSVNKFKKQIKAIDDICAGGAKKPLLSEILLLPFDDDPKVVGKWQLCGKLTDENDFNTLEKNTPAEADGEVIFMPGGAFAWKYFWTRGILYRLSPKYMFAIPNLYKTVKIDGVLYMIVQFIGDNCIDNGDDTVLLLYRQVDNVAYTEQQIRPHIDNTNLPFVDDEAVHGEWTVCDLVREISDFDPQSQRVGSDGLYTQSINFLPRGICTKAVKSTAGGVVNYMLRYTKDTILNDKEMTAESYIIKQIDGKEFLFAEHKSGDYFYGGLSPKFYVFKRKDN